MITIITVIITLGLAMKFFPSRSAFRHLRLPFSLFLLPVFIFALSQAPVINMYNACLAFVVWHLLVYPASNGFNSYFDKDEGSIALLKDPPPVDRSLYYLSLMLDLIALLIAVLISVEFFIAVVIYGTISKLYSHPAIRLKKYPFISFLTIFLFQGAFVYWTSYGAVSDLSIFYGWNLNFILAGLICSCLIGANYPLTQVYQHEEDAQRGDRTLSIQLGIKGSFQFSAAMFCITILISFWHWYNINNVFNFWLFLAFSFPVFVVFVRWLLNVWRDDTQANYKNMLQMTWTGGISMLSYFILILWLDR